MADATKVPAALANIIVTCSSCHSLGYARSIFCGEAILFSLENYFFQHGLGPQDFDRVRDPAQRFGYCCSDSTPGCVLRVLFTRVRVCWTGRRPPTAQSVLMVIPTK